MDEKELNDLNQAYKRIAETADGKVVLEDLNRFCRYDTTARVVSPVSGMIDPFMMAVIEGKREVYVHIMKKIKNEKEG